MPNHLTRQAWNNKFIVSRPNSFQFLNAIGFIVLFGLYFFDVLTKSKSREWFVSSLSDFGITDWPQNAWKCSESKDWVKIRNVIWKMGQNTYWNNLSFDSDWDITFSHSRIFQPKQARRILEHLVPHESGRTMIILFCSSPVDQLRECGRFWERAEIERRRNTCYPRFPSADTDVYAVILAALISRSREWWEKGRERAEWRELDEIIRHTTSTLSGNIKR